MKLKTTHVKDGSRDGTYINAVDFDKKIHKLFGVPKIPEKEPGDFDPETATVAAMEKYAKEYFPEVDLTGKAEEKRTQLKGLMDATK